MDTTIYFWTLQNDRFNLTKSQVTLTKMGPISHSVQDKSKNYFIHSNFIVNCDILSLMHTQISGVIFI